MRRIVSSNVFVYASMLCVLNCVGGDAPMVTALGQPIASDASRYTVTVNATNQALHIGSNDLSVHVQTAQGSAAVLTRVTAYMPAHGHSTDAPQISPSSNGNFDVRGLDLTMPGEWLISLKLSRDGTLEDDAATVWADPQ